MKSRAGSRLCMWPSRFRAHLQVAPRVSLPIALFILFASLLAGEQTSPQQIIGLVEAHYNEARTLSVEFTEDYSLLGHPRPVESGILRIKKQGKMRWDYQQPSGKLFVCDGKTMFLYTAADNRVERVPLRQADDMRAPLAFLLGRLNLRKEFRDFALQAAEAGLLLRAVARSDRLPYEGLRMTIGEAGTILALQIEGRDQSVLDFRFRNEQRNIPMAVGLFDFTPPPGAEIVDGLAMQAEGDR